MKEEIWMMESHITRMRFTAKVISGRGIGRMLGFPTLNFETPKNFKLAEGVYACSVNFAQREWDGVLFFGKRKTFADTKSLEIHILDEVIKDTPAEVETIIVKRIRGIKKFPSQKELVIAIAKDCAKAREILAV